MRRLLFRLQLFAVLALVLVPLAALAQAAAPTAPIPPSGFQVAVAQYVYPALGTALAGIVSAVGLFLAAWIRSRAKTDDQKAAAEKTAAFIERQSALASHAIAYVDAQTKATQQASFADGVVTPEEARKLQDEALKALKTFVGENFADEAQDVLGIAAPAVDTWLRGLLQRQFSLKPEKTLWTDTSTAPAVPGPATVTK